MQILITISDELAAQAVSQRMTPENYVQSLLADKANAQRRPAHELTLEELNEALDALARHSDKIPVLPIEALSRESIYQNSV